MSQRVLPCNSSPKKVARSETIWDTVARMDSDSRRLTVRQARWTLAVAALVVQIPFLERGISSLDEGSILAIADALRKGEALYADRVTPLAPLTYELTAVLFRLFGAHLIVARLLEAFVFAGCVVLTHSIISRIARAPAAFAGGLAVLALKPLAFPLWTIVNYSQIAMLLCLASLRIVLHFLDVRHTRWLLVLGIGIGVTIATKQNLGVLLGASMIAALVLDWVRGVPRAGAQLVVRSAVLSAGPLVPLRLVFGAFAARGTQDALVDRAVLGMRYLSQPYWVPLPGADLWFRRPAEVGMLAFTYFPPALVHLALEGRFDLASQPRVFVVEHLVKAAYYVPLFLLGATVLVAFRRWGGSHAGQGAASKLVTIAAFAAAMYAGMLYRADWIHLMNIYPALIVASVVPLDVWGARSAWGRRVAIGLAAVWLGAGLALTGVVLTTYNSVLETPRGRLLGAALETKESARVLRFVAGERGTERILFLRSEPLYYFLSGRSVPLPFDFLLPGVLRGDDDGEIARQLAAVDLVVYNPKSIPTAPSPITAYAPLTATALTTGFRVDRVLGPTAVVLRSHRSGDRAELTVVDVWEQFADRQPAPGDGADGTTRLLERQDGIERTSWMMYRVLSASVDTTRPQACFAMSHVAEGDETIALTPMLHPDTWSPAGRTPATTGAVFQIDIRRRGHSSESAFSTLRTPGPPGDPIRVPLAGYAHEEIEIRFCTALPDRDAPQPAHAPAGWAEPRIVRTAPSTGERRTR